MFHGWRQYLIKAVLFLLLTPILVYAVPQLRPAKEVIAFPQRHPAKVAFFNKPGSELLSRIALAVWSKAALNMRYRFVLVQEKSEAEALKALKEQKVDIVVGPIRLDKDDSQIYYVNSYIHDSVGIIIPDRMHVSFVDTLSGYFEALFGITVILIVVVIVIFGIIIWFFERKKNPNMYSKKPVKGIATSVWNCLVTFSTVGYGDIVPRTAVGRALTGVWIIISLFLVSAFVASITSELTYVKSKLDKLTSLSQLYNKKIAMIKGQPETLHLADRYHLVPVMYDNLADVVNAVNNHEVLAGMGNLYMLREYLNQHHKLKVILTPYELQRGYYAFALHNNNRNKAELSRVLYTLSEIGYIRSLIVNIIGPVHTPKKG
jgi:polar amino acid transport system substrate-binding protein